MARAPTSRATDVYVEKSVVVSEKIPVVSLSFVGISRLVTESNISANYGHCACVALNGFGVS